MLNLKAFAQWLAAEASLAVGGTLQVGAWEPNAPDKCALLREAGGRESFYEDHQLPRVQVLVRARGYFEARDLAVLIHGKLSKRTGIFIYSGSNPVHYIHTIEAEQLPFYLGAGQRGLHEMTANYRLRLRNAT